MSRRATLSVALAGAGSGIEFNEHLEHEDAAIVFQHACKFGLEGIVFKRKDLRYVSGRSPDWIKLKIRTRRLSAVRPKRIGENDSHDRLVWDG